MANGTQPPPGDSSGDDATLWVVKEGAAVINGDLTGSATIASDDPARRPAFSRHGVTRRDDRAVDHTPGPVGSRPVGPGATTSGSAGHQPASPHPSEPPKAGPQPAEHQPASPHPPEPPKAGPQSTGSSAADPVPASLAQVRELITAATAALDTVREVLWQAGGHELAQVMAEIGELALAGDAAEVAVLAETLARGEHRTGPAPLAIADWVCVHSRRYATPAGAATRVRLAEHISNHTVPDGLSEAVLTATAPVAAAAVAVAEMLRLRPDLQAGFIDTAWDTYTQLAIAGDIAQIRKLRPALIARYGNPDDLAKDEDQARDRAGLSRGYSDGGALLDYRLRLDTQSAATLEAALGPLSGPIPGPNGDPDPRPAETRRAHALLELITRAVKADDSIVGRSSTHTTVVVPLSDLIDDHGYGTVIGSLDAGRFLSLTTTRALSCAGHLTPVVVDHHGNPVLIGRTKRLFTPAQVAALIVRDAGCTFPGCTRPADWSDAHHLIHWSDGGTTDLDNAALLCRLHHNTVHSRHLAGRLTTGPPGSPDEHRLRIEWDLTPGSYAHALNEFRPGHDAA